ncbi:MAG: TlpA disulfide reductase family protein [Roseateles sp.]|uniref:TlpA disulfide reductase family protein n=1 Tax=Roseateles sp. TaxID=1971397 RepID=UPI0039ECFC74
MPTRRTLAATALALVCAAALGGCAREPAPAVDYVLLDGRPASSRQWAGKVMLVNFWATSCATCVKEMPQIVATHGKFKDRGFDTLAVAMSYDPPAFVARFAETRKLPFGVAIDNTGAVAQAFGPVQMTPTTFLIDKRGAIVKRYVGEPDFAALHALIEDLLAEA